MSASADTAGFMAMKGAGYYSKATTGARDVINLAVPLIVGAIERMGLADDAASFRAADLGCADGGTSVGMWRTVLGEVRRTYPTKPIEITYTDLPRNDFSQLFRMIHGQTDVQSYYGEIPDVYPFASATSFHQAIFPRASMNLLFSATASHYISKVPGPISDHVHMVGASGAERAAYEKIGRVEWERFLNLRARELVRGGRLCFLNFGIDSKGRYLGHTGGPSMFDTFNLLWRRLAESGRITAEEYRNTNFPQVYRTASEFTAPLRDEGSQVYRAGLRLEHVEERHLECPYAVAFKAHRDAARFAREYIPTLRSWSEPTFASGLSASRPPAERAAILDEFFGSYERLVAEKPDGHGMDYVHVHLICRKD
ncbi:MAG TPA: SAM-dependent methyltransferase [Hyphomicrobiaceae bacterium]|nr:SAM-dependent methyltransferase [Hyphomicrobiaceae bacterium]